MTKWLLPACAAGLVFASAGSLETTAHAACKAVTCTFGKGVIKHITDLHCSGTYGKGVCTSTKKSRFTDEICKPASIANSLETLCKTMLNDPSCEQTISSDGSTVTKATLDDKVGRDLAEDCSETAKITVIHDKSPTIGIKTAHPGFQ